MNTLDLIPKKEYFKYRDRHGRLLKIEYIKWLNHKWFKKTIEIEGAGRFWR